MLLELSVLRFGGLMLSEYKYSPFDDTKNQQDYIRNQL